jgi:branched-chain amino acid aminotransferase
MRNAFPYDNMNVKEKPRVSDLTLSALPFMMSKKKYKKRRESMAFTLNMFPWVYSAQYNGESWDEHYIEQEHLSPKEESSLPESERIALQMRRNNFSQFPLVNYTTQYGMGCFEGLKAYPQKNGGLSLFRPEENALRMKRSMEGLMMPSMEPKKLSTALLEFMRRNISLGFSLDYDSTWEEDNYLTAGAIYIRPFSYSESGIGINLSRNPWIIAIATPVSAYFKPGNNAAVTTTMIRATPGGTGWIKCDANYVIPALAKNKAIDKGFMECIFLDAKKHQYIEEGSSCHFFALLKDGDLVTPELGDTILPGITRKSVIQLAKDRGIKVEERPLTIKEVMENAQECFVTGTAAGITPLCSLTHKEKTTDFNCGKMGELTNSMLIELKEIQYGAREDVHGWMQQL